MGAQNVLGMLKDFVGQSKTLPLLMIAQFAIGCKRWMIDYAMIRNGIDNDG